MIPYVTLMRPLNGFMAVIGVLIGGLLVAGNDPSLFTNLFPLGLALLSVFLITGAGNSINDYFDVESDKVNKPRRPIPSGKVSKNAALAFSIILFAVGILLTVFINYVCLIIAVVNTLLLIAYSHSLQDRILLGNVVVGYLVGSTFLFGGTSLGNIILPGILMLLAGLSTITREIVKDLEDIEGDRKNFLKKIASGVKVKLSRFVGKKGKGGKDAVLAMNKRRARAAAMIFMLLAIIISPLPYVLNILGIAYLIILIPTDVVFLYSLALLAKEGGKKKYVRISKMIKIGMFLALMAFIFGVLF
jgi:geranylgeranylglycerol-phosphate geranylgeranyltransferase